MLMKEKLSLKTNALWCKGCGICVFVCPKQVLAVENEKVVIKDVDKCIKCGQCEYHCPDYAIYLEEEK
ncbi:MAG TPA: 4Fe-4S binding protein [Soehngenia sp.]|nr:4Fe-4S binding protein [Soehngenia sp.]HPP31859.1 4Fe-4S binding protein [Soehngenia sp.]